MADPRLLLNNSGRQVPSVQRPVDDKIVRGTISQVNGEGVFALIPEYSQTYQFGPLELVYSQGSTAPVVGNDCLVAFDAANVGYVLWFAATPAFGVPASFIHWLAPVAKESELPTTGNVLGDVRMVEETLRPSVCVKTTGTLGEQWKTATMAGLWSNIHTVPWTMAEKVTVGILPGPFVKLATEETQTLIGIEVELAKGKGVNEIEYSVERWDAEGTKTWAAIPGLTALKLKKEEVKAVTGLSVALHTKDRLRLNIGTITAEPEGLSLTAFVEHVAKAH